MENNNSLEGIHERPTELDGLDREAVEKIGKQFHDLVSAEILEKMGDPKLSTEFKSHEEIGKAYEKETKKSAGRGTEGFSKELKIPAQVCSEHRDITEQTVIHERLHQASNPDAKNAIGKRGMEGVTQALTDRLMGNNGDKSIIQLDEKGREYNFYPKETQMAKDLIVETGGPRAVEKLYFQNDANDLKEALGGEVQYEARMEQFKKLDDVNLRK